MSANKQFYGDTEATKYTAKLVSQMFCVCVALTNSSRIQNVQAEMTERALQLLALPEGESAYVLDIGCGSGLSGELLEEDGHVWVGVDVAPSMLGMSPHSHLY